MLGHMLQFYKLGGKQLYYFNTNDGQGEIDVNKSEDNQLEDLIPQEDCESCVI